MNSAESLLDGPCGLDELWVQTALGIRGLPANPRVCKSPDICMQPTSSIKVDKPVCCLRGNTRGKDGLPRSPSSTVLLIKLVALSAQ